MGRAFYLPGTRKFCWTNQGRTRAFSGLCNGMVVMKKNMKKKAFIAALAMLVSMGAGSAYGQFKINQWTGAGANANWATNANWAGNSYTSGSNAGIYFPALTGKDSATVANDASSCWTRYLLLGAPTDAQSTNYTINGGQMIFKYAAAAGYPESVAPEGSGYDLTEVNANKSLAIWAAGTGDYTVGSNITYDGGSFEKGGFLIRNDSTGTLDLSGHVGANSTAMPSFSIPTIIDGSGKTRINNFSFVSTTLTNNSAQTVDFYGTFTTRGTTTLDGTGETAINTLTFGNESYDSYLNYMGTGGLKINTISALKSDGASQLNIGATQGTGIHIVELTGDVNFQKGAITINGTDQPNSASMLTISGEGSTISAGTIHFMRSGISENGTFLGSLNVQANTTINANLNASWNGGIGVANDKTAILTGNFICSDGKKTVRKYGGGTLVLQGAANTLGNISGTLNIEAGRIRVDTGADLSTKTINVKNQAAIELAGGTYSGSKVNVYTGGRLVIDSYAGRPTDLTKYAASERAILSLNYGGANDWTAEQINQFVPETPFASLERFHLELNVAAGANASYTNSFTKAYLGLNLGAGSQYTTTQDTESISALTMNNATLNAMTGGTGILNFYDIKTENGFFTQIFVEGNGTSTINAQKINMTLANQGHIVIAPEATLVVNAVLADSSTGYAKELYLEGGGTLELKKAATYSGATHVENGTLKLSVARALLKDKDLYIEENGIVDLAVDAAIAWDNGPSCIYINGGKMVNSFNNHATLGKVALDGGTLTSYVNGTSANGSTPYGNFIFDKPINVTGPGTSIIEAKTISLRHDTASGRTGGAFNVEKDATLKLDATFRPATSESTAITLTGGGTLLLGANFHAIEALKLDIQNGTLDISEKNRMDYSALDNWSLFSTVAAGHTPDINSTLTLADGAVLEADLTLNADGSYTLPTLYVNNSLTLTGSTLELNLLGDGWEESMLDGLTIFDTEALKKVASQFSSVSTGLGDWVISSEGKLTSSQSVPEPSSVVLLILGVLGLVWLRRR